ncbi:MAG: integration host factor subunit alpha [Rhodospirillaceae bacterium]|mgnify:FL=1|nr:integration host factor subunit alpha [Rhodospirillaceae bacterium]
MTDQTVTRADLSEAVYQEVGLSRNESAALVESVLSEIADTLTSGETVKISSFGSFSVRQKGERVGRNPKTGEEVPILPRKVLVFRASNVLKNRINGEAGGDDDTDDGFSGADNGGAPQQQPDTPPPMGSGTPYRPGS